MSLGSNTGKRGDNGGWFGGLSDAWIKLRYQSSISMILETKMNQGADGVGTSCFSSAPSLFSEGDFPSPSSLEPDPELFLFECFGAFRPSTAGFGLRQIAFRFAKSSPSSKPSG